MHWNSVLFHTLHLQALGIFFLPCLFGGGRNLGLNLRMRLPWICFGLLWCFSCVSIYLFYQGSSPPSIVPSQNSTSNTTSNRSTAGGDSAHGFNPYTESSLIKLDTWGQEVVAAMGLLMSIGAVSFLCCIEGYIETDFITDCVDNDTFWKILLFGFLLPALVLIPVSQDPEPSSQP